MPILPIYWRFLRSWFGQAWSNTDVQMFLKSVGEIRPPTKTISKSERTRNGTKITGLYIEFNKKASLGPCHKKLLKPLNETDNTFTNWIWNVWKLQDLLGCWKWFLLLVRPDVRSLKIVRARGRRKKPQACNTLEDRTSTTEDFKFTFSFQYQQTVDKCLVE